MSIGPILTGMRKIGYFFRAIFCAFIPEFILHFVIRLSRMLSVEGYYMYVPLESQIRSVSYPLVVHAKNAHLNPPSLSMTPFSSRTHVLHQ